MNTWLSGKLIAWGNVAKTDQWHLCFQLFSLLFCYLAVSGCHRGFHWFWCLVALSLIFAQDLSIQSGSLLILFSSTGYFYYFSLYINPWSQKLQFFSTLGSVRCQKRDEEKSADGQKHYSRLVLWKRKKMYNGNTDLHCFITWFRFLLMI